MSSTTDDELRKVTFNNIRVQVRKRQLLITYKCIHIIIQVDFIIALENFKCLRRHSECKRLECEEKSKIDLWLKLENDSQKEEMERFRSSKNVRIESFKTCVKQHQNTADHCTLCVKTLSLKN